MTLGQRIVIMDQGRIQQIAPPMEIYNKPANLFVAGFIGSPAMNFFPGCVEAGKFNSGVCNIEFANAANGDAILGVRPEDLKTSGEGPKLGEVTLEVVEHMGHETMVYFHIQNQQYAARLDANQPYQPGDQLTLFIQPNKWHLFAADESWQAIGINPTHKFNAIQTLPQPVALFQQ